MTADPLTDIFSEQDTAGAESRYPLTAEIEGHDGTSAYVRLTSFPDNRFGPISYVRSTSLADGSTVLVVRDQDDSFWIIAP